MHPAVQRFIAERGRPPRLLIFVAEDWHFCTHRLPLARGAVAAGFDVTVMARYQDHAAVIAATGARTLAVPLRRGRAGIGAEIAALHAIIGGYRQVAPDIAHQVAMKPVLYGTLAARLSRTSSIVNALAGLGYLFLAESFKGKVLRRGVSFALRWALKGKSEGVILQNPDDVALLVGAGLVHQEQVHLIRGSGVDLTQFTPAPLPDGDPVVVLPARLLWDKGVAEFVEAARLLRARGVKARLVLVGGPDEENPTSVPTAQLAAWEREGTVEWWGARDDMPAVLASASIVCLPSYREGLPKALLEGAAAGRALVAADVPGCREVVRPGENGLLAPARDSSALADALAQVLTDPARMREMGKRAREIAEAEFGVERVVAATVEVYAGLLEGAR